MSRSAHPELTIRQQHLVEKSQWIAAYVVRQMRRSALIYRRADREEMIAAACVGLCIAAAKFDQKRGCKFSTYAGWWCRNYAQRSILSDWPCSLPARILYNRGDTSPALVTRSTLDPNVLSAPTPTESIDLSGLLVRLDSRSRRVIEAKYLEGRSVREIAKEIGVGHARVHQILKHSLTRLRQLAGVVRP